MAIDIVPRWNPRRSWRVKSILQCSQVFGSQSLLQLLCGIRCGDKINCLFIASANFSSIAKRAEKREVSEWEKEKSFIYVSFVLRFEANLYLFSCFYLAKLDSLSLYFGCKILCGSLNLFFLVLAAMMKRSLWIMSSGMLRLCSILGAILIFVSPDFPRSIKSFPIKC